MKLKGKYKEFRYKITSTGYLLNHKHFRVCSGTLKMPFDRIDLKKPKSKDVQWMRKKIYSECEKLLKNPWWSGLDKKEKTINYIIKEFNNA